MVAKTQIKKIDVDWKAIKNECRNTSNKNDTDAEATETFIKKVLISEHSPIRMAHIRWRWEGLKSWVSVHFARHHIGVEKWISTQRVDRTGVDRDASRQDTLVNMEMEANPQALINMARFRMCYQASKETRMQIEDLKMSLKENGQEQIADVMQKNCVYRCGCPEFKSCGYWEKFVKNHKDENLLDIQNRYDLANNDFYKMQNELNKIVNVYNGIKKDGI